MPRKTDSNDKKRPVSSSVPEHLIEMVDAECEKRGMSRSAFTVLLYDLYFREQKLAEGVAQAASPAPFDSKFLEPVTSRLDALERKADNQIEATKSTREAVRSIPDLIRKDLFRHINPLFEIVKNDSLKGAEGRRIIAQQVVDSAGQISDLLTRVDRISAALRTIFDGKSGG